MCRNGRYTECGIKQRHGFARERWRIESGFAVRLDPALGGDGVLLEPTSVVAKAWEHIERIGRRARWTARARSWSPGRARSACSRRCWACSAGSMCTCSTGSTDGPKPDLVRAARRHLPHRRGPASSASPPTSCSSAPAPHRSSSTSSTRSGPDGIVCLTGVSTGGRAISTSTSDRPTASIVLENNVVFGSVNANLRHWQAAAEALRGRRSGLAVGADHAPGAAGRVRRRADGEAGRREGGR